MTRGWFIGKFEPSVYKNENFEVGVLEHKKNEKWDFHCHDKTLEINVLLSGKMIINEEEILPNEIFIFEPKMLSVPKFIEDSKILCIKIPSHKDKIMY